MREGIAAEQPQVGIKVVSRRREDKDLNSVRLDAPTQRLGCMASCIVVVARDVESVQTGRWRERGQMVSGQRCDHRQARPGLLARSPTIQ